MSQCTHKVTGSDAIRLTAKQSHSTVKAVGILPYNPANSIQVLQYLFEYVVPNLAVISGVRKNLMITFHLNSLHTLELVTKCASVPRTQSLCFNKKSLNCRYLKKSVFGSLNFSTGCANDLKLPASVCL